MEYEQGSRSKIRGVLGAKSGGSMIRWEQHSCQFDNALVFYLFNSISISLHG